MGIPLFTHLFPALSPQTHQRKALVKELRQINHRIRASLKTLMQDSLELQEQKDRCLNTRQKQRQVAQEYQELCRLLKLRASLRTRLSAR